MADWADVAIEEARQVRQLDVSGLGFKTKTGEDINELPFMTMNGDDYFILRKHEKFREMREKLGRQFDKDAEGQVLGLLACWMRFYKADETLSYKKFFQLPLETQLQLVTRMDSELGVSDLGGGGGIPSRE